VVLLCSKNEPSDCEILAAHADASVLPRQLLLLLLLLATAAAATSCRGSA
jgi:hypothetical protein